MSLCVTLGPVKEKPFSIRFDTEVLEYLKRRKAETDLSFGYQVNRALKREIAEEKAQKRKPRKP